MTVTVTCSSAVDVSALLLGADGRVRSDGDFIFFNQPVGPGVVYRHGRGTGDMVDVQTSALPAEVERVAITASLDGSGPATFAGAGTLTATVGSAAGTLTFPMNGLTSEAAVVCVEIYRRGDGWKVRAVGQGYDDGLAGLAAAFGVNIDDEPEPPVPAQPAPAPTLPAHALAPQPAQQPLPQPAQYPPTRPNPAAAQTPLPPALPAQGFRPPVPAPPPPAAPQQIPTAPRSFAPPSHPPAAPVPNNYAPQGAPSVQSELFHPNHAEVTGYGIQKQGSKMIRVAVDGETLARAGSMVAYQGDLHFKALGSGGIGRAIQHRLTGEGVPLMQVSGRGDLFLANAASDVHIVDLDGTDGLTINGANVLAFDSSLSYNIQRVQGAAGFASNAGFFNCVFSGRGRIAITTHGQPVVLNVDQPTYADPQAAVAWSSSLQTGIKRNDSFGFGRLIGRSTGEGLTLSFSGRGFVIVQPSELPPGGLIGGTGGGQEAGQSGGLLGGLLG
ncbi:AIM24 family protein [Nocardia aurantiaca]|uniref:Stress protein n=1 Tax=Nocardia aurantiaca TaxID=2675850 RepID=A0A6I3L5T3_9NOCA|nr:AIM24 family protein [Nocardia aurantiaca]MTE16024.1 stress protein [Nocardia aurantiaca]